MPMLVGWLVEPILINPAILSLIETSRDDGVVVPQLAPGRLVGLFQVRHGGAALATGVVVRVRQLDALRQRPDHRAPRRR